MANTLNLGNGEWGTKEDSLLGYNSENAAYKPLAFDFTRASSGTVVNRQGLIETVQSGIPRIDFLGNTKGALLLEPQSTNLLPYSSDFSNAAWGKQSAGVASAPIVTSNYSISPDGTQNADRVIFDINGGTTSSDLSQIAESVGSSIGDVTNSLWIKSNTASNYNMSFVNAFGNFTSIIVTNQWQRFDVTSTTVSTSPVLKLRLRGSESTSDSADVSIWGAQIEQNYLTSYIPTQGSTVTRVQEVCNNGGSASTFNNSQGVLYVEVKGFQEAPDSSGYITISSPTVSFTNAVIMQFRNNGDLRIYIGGSASSNIQFIDANINFTENNKIAVQYDSIGSNYKLFVNGVSIARRVQATNQSVSGLSELNFNYGTLEFVGNVKAVAVWKTFLTDLELEKLSSWTSFSSMAQSLNYTIQ